MKNMKTNVKFMKKISALLSVLFLFLSSCDNQSRRIEGIDVRYSEDDEQYRDDDRQYHRDRHDDRRYRDR